MSQADGDPPSTAAHRRAAPRARVSLTARVGTVAGDDSVVLENLSTTGARIAQPRLRIGSSVLLQIGNLECFGDVVWSDDASSGIAFDEPIDEAEVVRIRRESDWLPGDADVRQAARDWALGFR